MFFMINKPNLLMIHVDQQRYDCLGFTGHPLVKTPHLDRLRREGMSFCNAYSPIPLCCPARQTLLSGVMPEVHGGLWNYDSQVITGLTKDFPTWTESLKAQGFGMSYFGKWHVSSVLDPTDFGYDSYEPEPRPFQPENSVRRYEMPDNHVWPHTGLVSQLPLEESSTHRMTARAIETMKDFHGKGDPWHIRLDFSEPHLPCVPSEPFASLYDPEDILPWENFQEDFKGKPFIQSQQLKNWEIEGWTWKEWSRYMALYLGIISQYDDAVGLILSVLDDIGAAGNTVVVYTTDHGDAAGSHRMMDKHYVMYEEEVHVPLIVRWPGVVRKNSGCSDFVMNALDLGPTLLDLYSLPVPDTFQGKSFLPQLKGKTQEDPWPAAFSSYHGQQFGLYDMRMIRDERYKYVYNPTDTDEFYDLQEDPGERHNLIGSDKDIALGGAYRRRIYETFHALDDRLMTQGPWIRNHLDPIKSLQVR